MRKVIFLEYKFGDYDAKTLYVSGASEVVAWMEKLNPARLKQLQDWGVKISLSFSGFDDSACPLSPESETRIRNLMNRAISLHPSGIIIDHFRFSGHWERKKLSFNNTHSGCKYCQGKDRGLELAKIAKLIKQSTPPNIEVGYYAVPRKYAESSVLGQNHELLGQIFDYSSPMLYHRMIGKPVSYISKFTQYLSDLTHKSVLPTIQVKDMPDDLPDGITGDILRQEYLEAIKPFSAGVAWFSWDGAVEKEKTAIIGRLFSEI